MADALLSTWNGGVSRFISAFVYDAAMVRSDQLLAPTASAKVKSLGNTVNLNGSVVSKGFGSPDCKKGGLREQVRGSF